LCINKADDYLKRPFSSEEFFDVELFVHFNVTEFVVLMDKESLGSIEFALQRFHQETTIHSFSIDGVSLKIKLNIGAQVVVGNKSMHCLLEGADKALIKANKQGGNRLHICSE